MTTPIARHLYRIALPLLLMAGPALAQNDTSAEHPSKIKQTEQTAGKIASQPVTDVGVKKVVIPAVLQRAVAAPYGVAGTATCPQIVSNIRQLNAALGPDFGAGAKTNESRASQLAQAGGQALVNSLIPFRGLVREVSGAAPAQRRLNAAIDTGYARRGFLRGLAQAKGCKIR